MEALIGMTDFVLNVPISGMEVQSIGIQGNNRYQKCIRYANFLKQQLEIWQFIPCKLVDGVWVVLEKPKREAYMINLTHSYIRQGDYDSACEEYQEAKERCLFEGFEYKKEIFIHNTEHLFIEFKGCKIFWNFNNKWELYKEFKTIEDLVKYNPKLTDTAKKHIGF